MKIAFFCFANGELDEDSTCAIFAQMGNDDKRNYCIKSYL